MRTPNKSKRKDGWGRKKAKSGFQDVGVAIANSGGEVNFDHKRRDVVRKADILAIHHEVGLLGGLGPS
jgi:hypothetical protein